jgi:hypothetical protein
MRSWLVARAPCAERSAQAGGSLRPHSLARGSLAVDRARAERREGGQRPAGTATRERDVAPGWPRSTAARPMPSRPGGIATWSHRSPTCWGAFAGDEVRTFDQVPGRLSQQSEEDHQQDPHSVPLDPHRTFRSCWRAREQGQGHATCKIRCRRSSSFVIPGSNPRRGTTRLEGAVGERTTRALVPAP